MGDEKGVVILGQYHVPPGGVSCAVGVLIQADSARDCVRSSKRHASLGLMHSAFPGVLFRI